MIEKTQAIVLRYHPFSNTSRVVSWLTPGSGRITTLVKGSQRPRSWFLGQYDLFYTCELVYYVRERTSMHIARECSPQKTRDRFREDWKACAAASYLADLMWRVSPPDAPHAGLFDLLDTALDDLAESGAAAQFVFWFELKFMHVLGLAPRLRRCLVCGKELLVGAGRSKFCYARGSILCGTCARESSEVGVVPIAPDILAMLTGWQRAQTPQAALSTQCTRWQLGEIEKLLGLFLTYHLETSFSSRGIALGLLNRNGR
jgi:DNA repair protein RecO (recombination protein O)